ncbi:MAG: LutB/LldF family L-lactate oxidation iron-sulfur protein [Bacteroidota bacterium]|nr:LutB/LldF family L-lactate oxidation iron-sulfur protein [Bacteroidota bacterium]
MENISTKYFRENIQRSLLDEKLRWNVKKATDLTLSKRKSVIEDIETWELLREKAYRIRKNAIDNLDYYLELFENKCRGNDVQVIRATDGEDACTIVNTILKSVDAKLVVKSKSMVTEEIHLNEHLEESGVEVVETDLGEYIIQLAGETPSHITAPALHKSREEIGKLFSEKLELPYSSDPTVLTGYARNILREKFLNADAGISGANFLIAETGTIVLVENEGNARLSTTLPKIHIIITGIEKIIPSVDEALLLLKLLPTSATGQKITSYVSFINKPKQPDDIDGPKKIFVILLDNGRRNLLKYPETSSALYCIKCGACMNICPVYQTVGGHAYNSVYPGPIGSILTPTMSSFCNGKDLAYGSSLCGACTEICPVKINIHHTLLWIRSQAVENSYTPFIEKLLFRVWRSVMQNVILYNILSKIMQFLQPLMLQDGLKIREASASKNIPELADKSFHEIWKSEFSK